jgi:uncharacterized protein (TIGR00730 family)
MALPGGFGTFDELLEVLTWAQLGFHSKPIGLANVGGYFDPFIKVMDQAVAEGFARDSARELVDVDDDPTRLLDRLAQRLRAG